MSCRNHRAAVLQRDALAERVQQLERENEALRNAMEEEQEAAWELAGDVRVSMIDRQDAMDVILLDDVRRRGKGVPA